MKPTAVDAFRSTVRELYLVQDTRRKRFSPVYVAVDRRDGWGGALVGQPLNEVLLVVARSVGVFYMAIPNSQDGLSRLALPLASRPHF